MPGVDGLKATRQITRNVPDTRVVTLSNISDDDVGLLGLRAGAVGFISKDTSVEALPRAVRGVHRSPGRSSSSRVGLRPARAAA
jgi:DNA-binding NarL/FixJ family response regulator